MESDVVRIRKTYLTNFYIVIDVCRGTRNAIKDKKISHAAGCKNPRKRKAVSRVHTPRQIMRKKRKA